MARPHLSPVDSRWSAAKLTLVHIGRIIVQVEIFLGLFPGGSRWTVASSDPVITVGLALATPLALESACDGAYWPLASSSGLTTYQSPLFLPASEIFLATDPDCFRRPRLDPCLDPCLDRLWPGGDRAVVFLRSPPIAVLVNGTRCTGAASSCPWSSLPRYVGLTGRVADSSFLPPAGAG